MKKEHNTSQRRKPQGPEGGLNQAKKNDPSYFLFYISGGDDEVAEKTAQA